MENNNNNNNTLKNNKPGTIDEEVTEAQNVSRIDSKIVTMAETQTPISTVDSEVTKKETLSPTENSDISPLTPKQAETSTSPPSQPPKEDTHRQQEIASQEAKISEIKGNLDATILPETSTSPISPTSSDSTSTSSISISTKISTKTSPPKSQIVQDYSKNQQKPQPTKKIQNPGINSPQPKPTIPSTNTIPSMSKPRSPPLPTATGSVIIGAREVRPVIYDFPLSPPMKGPRNMGFPSPSKQLRPPVPMPTPKRERIRRLQSTPPKNQIHEKKTSRNPSKDRVKPNVRVPGNNNGNPVMMKLTRTRTEKIESKNTATTPTTAHRQSTFPPKGKTDKSRIHVGTLRSHRPMEKTKKIKSPALTNTDAGKRRPLGNSRRVEEKGKNPERRSHSIPLPPRKTKPNNLKPKPTNSPKMKNHRRGETAGKSMNTVGGGAPTNRK